VLLFAGAELTRFEVHPHGQTAIATYVVEETEEYFGRVIHARYLTTDTWHRTPEGWRLIAAQVTALRQDPPAVTLPPGRLDVERRETWDILWKRNR